jgi:hypothetical protein
MTWRLFDTASSDVKGLRMEWPTMHDENLERSEVNLFVIGRIFHYVRESELINCTHREGGQHQVAVGQWHELLSQALDSSSHCAYVESSRSLGAFNH